MQPVKYRTMLVGMLIVFSLLVACGAPATRAPPTVTPVPPTLTAVPATATLLPPTATAVPPTRTPTPTVSATPAPTPVLATRAKDIIGTWFGLGTDGLYQRFYENGTCQTGVSAESVDVECTFRFEGTQVIITEVKAIGLPPCGSKTSIYEVQLLPTSNIRFVKVQDSCAPRARSTAQEHKRIR